MHCFFLNHSSLLVRNLCSFERKEGKEGEGYGFLLCCCSVGLPGRVPSVPRVEDRWWWQSRTGLRRARECLQGHLVQFPTHNTEDTSVLMQKIFLYGCLFVCFVFFLVAYNCPHHFQTLHCFILLVCWCSGFFFLFFFFEESRDQIL